MRQSRSYHPPPPRSVHACAISAGKEDGYHSLTGEEGKHWGEEGKEGEKRTRDGAVSPPSSWARGTSVTCLATMRHGRHLVVSGATATMLGFYLSPVRQSAGVPLSFMFLPRLRSQLALCENHVLQGEIDAQIW